MRQRLLLLCGLVILCSGLSAQLKYVPVSPPLIYNNVITSIQQGHITLFSPDAKTAVFTFSGGSGNSDTSSAFVYRLNGGTWVLQARLSILDPDSTVITGLAVSANGNTIAMVGAQSIGIVCVWQFENGSWKQQFKWNIPKNAATHAVPSISYNGNTILVHDQVWVRTGNTWTQQATLIPDDRPLPWTNSPAFDSANRFSLLNSCSLSADGNTAVIGDLYIQDTTTNAWVFKRVGTNWIQQGNRLEGVSNQNTLYLPGVQTPGRVSISGDGQTIGLGIGFLQSTHYYNSIWVFHLVGNTWVEQSNGPLQGAYPYIDKGAQCFSFSYDGNRLVTGRGDARFFFWKRNAGIWSQIGQRNHYIYTNTLDSTALPSSYAPCTALVLDSTGNFLLAGAPDIDNFLGAVFYYGYDSTNGWSQISRWQKIDTTHQSSITGAPQICGDGSMAFVSAGNLDCGNGAVFAFSHNNGVWQQFGSKLSMPDSTLRITDFGEAISFSADARLLSIYAKADSRQKIYFYYKGLNSYVGPIDSITSPTNGNFFISSYGMVLSDDGNTLVVNSSYNNFYVYIYSGGRWLLQDTIPSDNYSYNPYVISSDGNTIAIGNRSFHNNKGSISVYKRTGGIWNAEITDLQPASLVQGDLFPTALSISKNGDVVTTGCGNCKNYDGNIYVCRRTGSSWSSLDSIMPDDTHGLQHGNNLWASPTGDTIIEFTPMSTYLTTLQAHPLQVYIRNGTQWNEETRFFSASGNCPVTMESRLSFSNDMQYLAAIGIPNQKYMRSEDGHLAIYRCTDFDDSIPNISSASCAGYADGSIQLNVSGGTPPYQYIWSNGAINTNLITALLPAVYAVTITDANRDTMIRRYEVKAIKYLKTDSVSTTFNCSMRTGSIQAFVSGGTPPYTWLWNSTNAQTTNPAINLLSGTYLFSATDASGCLLVDSAIIPHSFTWLSITSSQPDCGTNGSATATLYGGQAPYSYLWNTGDSTATISAGPGIYLSTVTDASGCSATGSTILVDSCASHISGTVFFDRDNNCIQSANEHSAIGYTMMATNGVITAYGSTDDSGHYFISIPYTGNYNVSIAHWQQCSYLMCTGVSYPAQVSIPVQGATANNINFPLLDSGIDLAVEAQYNEPFPGSTINYQVFYGNLKDSVVPNGIVMLVYDSNLVVVNTIPPYTTLDTTLHTIIWNVSNITMLYPYNQFVQANLQVPLSVLPHTMVKISSSIAPTIGDCNIQNNSLESWLRILGSLDPNFKEAYPENLVYVGDSIITYTIHFQNTGVDSTHFIEILDTLSPFLDPASVRTVATFAHPYSFNIKENGILDWKFDPYALVDSTTDPINSHGFVSFEVTLKDSIVIGTNIHNTASIYFDYNSAVVTNTLTNRLTCPTKRQEIFASVCQGETFNFYNHHYNTAGNYNASKTNPDGCDSTFVLHLTVIDSSTTPLNTIICKGETYPFNGQNLNITGIYYQLLHNTNGCDSLVALHLTVDSTLASISLAGSNILVVNFADTVQWLDCVSGLPVSGATNNVFTATVSGSYRAIIKNGNCTDTSTCVTAIVNGIDEISADNFQMFPNPATDQVFIVMEQNAQHYIDLYDAKGALVNRIEQAGKNAVLNISNLASGIYLVEVKNTTTGNSLRKKLVKLY